MHGNVIHKNTALQHHHLGVAKALREEHKTAQTSQHDSHRIEERFAKFSQSAIDQTKTQIMHGPDCRLCLLRHNRRIYQMGRP
jgi:hypothetical protein